MLARRRAGGQHPVPTPLLRLRSPTPPPSPPPRPQQTKGKAAIDVICNPLGKSGGALIQQFMIIGFGSLAASTPYLGLILLGIVGMWLYAAKVSAAVWGCTCARFFLGNGKGGGGKGGGGRDLVLLGIAGVWLCAAGVRDPGSLAGLGARALRAVLGRAWRRVLRSARETAPARRSAGVCPRRPSTAPASKPATLC